jgi:hypothetical protein
LIVEANILLYSVDDGDFARFEDLGWVNPGRL